jgi:hypothetical protein
MERDAAQCAGRDDDRGRGTIGGFSPNSVLDSRWFILAFLGISWLPDLFDVKRDESIDILFTDINLPDGPDAIDGLELARKAVELLPKSARDLHNRPWSNTALHGKQLTEAVLVISEEDFRR